MIEININTEVRIAAKSLNGKPKKEYVVPPAAMPDLVTASLTEKSVISPSYALESNVRFQSTGQSTRLPAMSVVTIWKLFGFLGTL